MAAEGARVVVADVQDGGSTVATIEAAGGRALAVACDVADPAQVEAAVAAAVDAYGGLDVLVNNAGISGGSGLAHEVEVEDWLRTVAVNLTGPFLCVRAAMPHLLASGRGRVVNIASTYGVVGAPQAAAYCATKGGVVNLTRQLAVDYGPLGVRVNAILPGYIDTDMGGYRAGLGPEGAAAANATAERRPRGSSPRPPGRCGGGRQRGRVPGQRRVVLHDRRDRPRRRGLHDHLSPPLAQSSLRSVAVLVRSSSGPLRNRSGRRGALHPSQGWTAVLHTALVTTGAGCPPRDPRLLGR